VNACVATVLFVSPAAVAIAFTVMVDATRNGAWYTWDDVDGVLPSSV
jgi:hypothetical protein